MGMFLWCTSEDSGCFPLSSIEASLRSSSHTLLIVEDWSFQMLWKRLAFWALCRLCIFCMLSPPLGREASSLLSFMSPLVPWFSEISLKLVKNHRVVVSRFLYFVGSSLRW